jgi:diguanylate cyclase (GGDEF)-like protein
VILCIGAVIFIPINTYSDSGNDADIELIPSEIVTPNEDTQEYHFKNIDWEGNGDCLHFLSVHQEIEVEADGKLLFERKGVATMWGHTPGYAREYIEIPIDTKEVTITVTAVYPEVRDEPVVFYQGFAVGIFRSIFHEEWFTLVISFLNICLGAFLFIFGVAAHKRTNVGGAMAYLGIFTILLGVWSCLENGLVALLVDNRAASSYITFTSLAMIGYPLVMFVRRYLQTEDKYVYKILLWLNLINVILGFMLQYFEIVDMKQILWTTHIMLVLSLLYLPFSIADMIRRHAFTHKFWVAVWSLISMCPPSAYSLYLYYHGSEYVTDYGDIMFFVFVMIFAVDVSHSIMKDIDMGKEVAIYRELAEKDMLTGCYNRNAYRKDTCDWSELQGVQLLTCDLNNLKKCNDTLGHAYGDQYIVDAAAMLKKLFSQYGKVYRIGGDEFCIVIPAERRCNIGKMLTVLTEEERIYNANSEAIDLQIACGFAEYNPKTDFNMEDIRNRADELMYENKKELKRRSKYGIA